MLISLFSYKFLISVQSSFLLSLNDHGAKDKNEPAHMAAQYRLLVYHGQALFEDEQYRRAEV